MPIAKPKRSIRQRKLHKPDVIIPVDDLLTITSTIKRFTIASSDLYIDIINFTYSTQARQLTVVPQGFLPAAERQYRADILRKHFKTLKLEVNDGTKWLETPLATFDLDDSTTFGSTMMRWILDVQSDLLFQGAMNLIQTLNRESRWRWGQ
jgi:hypothetical protein